MEKLDPITREEKFMAAAAGDTTEKLTPITRKEKFLARIAENAGSGGGGTGGANIDVVAEVGQTIRVKEVDANGKPTSWEAADYQERTHWKEMGMVEILPETTIEIDPDSSQVASPIALGLVLGKSYSVRWNGTEYNCTAQDMNFPVDEEGNMVNIGVAVGNVGVMLDGEGTGEPFIIVDLSPEYSAQIGGIPTMIQALDGSESAVVSILAEGEVFHPLQQEYLPNAFPYYIDLAEAGIDEFGYMTYSCAESREKLIALYKSGRNLIVRCRVPGENWNTVKSYIWCETREEVAGGTITLRFKEIYTYADDPLPEMFTLWVKSDKVFAEPAGGKDYNG